MEDQTTTSELPNGEADDLVTSDDRQHPANLICELCRNFYQQGWVRTYCALLRHPSYRRARRHLTMVRR